MVDDDGFVLPERYDSCEHAPLALGPLAGFVSSHLLSLPRPTATPFFGIWPPLDGSRTHGNVPWHGRYVRCNHDEPCVM